MHYKFPKKIDKIIRRIKHAVLPKKLFFRTLLMILLPLLAVQIVSIWTFFDVNWGRVGRSLSNNVAQDIYVLVNLVNQDISNKTNIAEIEKMSSDIFGIDMHYYDQSSKPSAYKKIKKGKKIITNFLKDSLKTKFANNGKAFLYRGTGDKNIIVVIEQEHGLFQFSVPEKKFFTSSMFAFIIWMSITSVLMFIIVSLFLRIQVRSISDLAKVAEDFGKGEENSKFKPYGSEEVRSAGLAFIKMRERIVRQVSERTQMLAGISHDLRTPLSRMKLEMALIPNGPDKEGFLKDIFEMEQMLDGYISFVSKGTGEKTSTININNMISEILKGFRSKKALVSYFAPDKTPLFKAREQSLKRALTNIIGNAFYYGKTIVVRLETNNNNFEIMVEDDGPGIPKEKREDVFKAFYRIDGSRNKETGGVGLGLAIAKDIILAHGGSIELGESKGLKGLKVFITLPL